MEGTGLSLCQNVDQARGSLKGAEDCRKLSPRGCLMWPKDGPVEKVSVGKGDAPRILASFALVFARGIAWVLFW